MTTSPTQNTVSAIVVTYNSAQVITACIASLIAAGMPTDQIIIVDNASIDNTVTYAEQFGVQIIKTGQNLGYGRANNIGVRAATTSLCLIINPDVQVTPESIQILVDHATANSSGMIFAPKIIEPDGRIFYGRTGILGPFASGACFLTRRDNFLSIGGFDENIFLFYEDDDLCRRFSDLGSPPVYVDSAIVHHDRGHSVGPVTPQKIYISRFHQAASRFYIRRKYQQVYAGKIDFGRLQWLFFYGAKFLCATILNQKIKKSRYGGSFMGAWCGLSKNNAPLSMPQKQ